MDVKQANLMLKTALDIGEHMLMTGADVTRVEDTVARICRKYDAQNIEVFCIASLLQASVRLSNGEYCTQMRRVTTNDNNLARLEALNAISRQICSGNISLEEAGKEVDRILTLECYKSYWYYLAGILGSSAFTIFFGGNLMDGLSAAIASLPVMYLERHPYKHSTQLVNTIFESFVGGLIVNLMVLIGLGQNIDYICIGVVMLLIPGMKFGNAMQDFMRADVLAGSAKFVHALLLSLMIVLGFAMSMLCFGVK